MASLLNEEEEALLKGDDFYASKYGGFADEQEDGDFKVNAANMEDDEDQVDSDFSIDENDEVRSDLEDEEEAKKRVSNCGKHGVVTKAYKEPASTKRTSVEEEKRKRAEAEERKKRRAQQMVEMATSVLSDGGRKGTIRASTLSKTAETAKRQREREMRAKKMLKKRLAAKRRKLARGGQNEDADRELTQEELLAEAKVTEELNLASLKKYEQMELEAKRKANKMARKRVRGPFIRYLSTTMPLIQVRNCHYSQGFNLTILNLTIILDLMIISKVTKFSPNKNS